MTQPLNMRIANIIREHGYTTIESADAILAAIREHITTDDALDRASAAYWSDGDLVADIGDVLKKSNPCRTGGRMTRPTTLARQIDLMVTP